MKLLEIINGVARDYARIADALTAKARAEERYWDSRTKDEHERHQRMERNGARLDALHRTRLEAECEAQIASLGLHESSADIRERMDELKKELAKAKDEAGGGL